MSEYTATEFSSVKEKQHFEEQFKRFISKGFRRTMFPKWFYVRLSMCFGMIAHYNQDTFYDYYFTSDQGKTMFCQEVLTYGCYGSPEYTFSDVEKVLKEWIVNHMCKELSK